MLWGRPGRPYLLICRRCGASEAWTGSWLGPRACSWCCDAPPWVSHSFHFGDTKELLTRLGFAGCWGMVGRDTACF